ncbi:MAG: hypothetical protein KAJ10_10245, partial [Thermodesulfovibrionia bacterium]|nr:hypothetical protein [Thermodesulfovibrionia bacterium]
LLYRDYIHSFLFDFLIIRTGTILGFFPPFPEELTKAIIREMKRYSNEHGAHFVVLNWRWTDDFNTGFLNDLDIDIIDTLEEAPADWDKMVILGGVHPTAQASDHAAMLLLKYFHKKDLL